MNEQATLRKANADELREIYGWMQRQFHAGELKSLDRLYELEAEGAYEAYGLRQGDALIAYALLGHTKDHSRYLLDYYAVLPEYQNAGWGSRCLALLREKLPGDALLLEVEDPDFAPDAAELEHFCRRIRFYGHNGCVSTKIRVKLFGFDYAIMQLPIRRALEKGEVFAAMQSLYDVLVPPEYHAENVHVYVGEPS